MLSEAEKQKIAKEKAKAKAKALKEKEKAKAMKEKEKAKAKKEKEKAKAKAKKEKEKAKKARVKGGDLDNRLAVPDDLRLPIGDEILVIVDVDLTKLDLVPEMSPEQKESEFIKAASNIAIASLTQESGGCIYYRIYNIGHSKYKMFELYANQNALKSHIASEHMQEFRTYKFSVASAKSGAFVSTNKTEDDFISQARVYHPVNSTFTGEEILIPTPTPLKRYGGFFRTRF
jgi:quinol monooxygenase YgiN